MVGRLLFLAWMIVAALATDEPEKGCVNHPASFCPVADKETSFCLCQRIEADTTVICCNIQTEFELKESLSCAFQKKENQSLNPQTLTKPPPVTALHILNSTLERLDVTLNYFQGLIGLSVTQSQISRIMGKFPSSITCLNLSSNHLIEIDPVALSSVPHLGYLDLSNNNLTHIPTLEFKNTKAYFFLDVSGNPKLLCKPLHLLKAQTNPNVQVNFVNENDTFCSTPSDYQWFNSVNVIPFHQLDILDKMLNECPKGPDFECRCILDRKVEVMKERLFYVSVDCSNQGLKDLPQKLPPFTASLNISNNNITKLDFLASNKENYEHIANIFADNNRIESIIVLEGSQFIERFTFLSLRNNKIKAIPKYLLSNLFDRNEFKLVKLGMNKLQCDCSTAQVLKVWLLANKNHIPDFDELLCENYDNTRVVDLDQKKVCIYPRDWTDYIYYIIALEIILFALLVSKVSYDYWVFKTTGYLPWPASKMPRLPCDWVFEL